MRKFIPALSLAAVLALSACGGSASAETAGGSISELSAAGSNEMDTADDSGAGGLNAAVPSADPGTAGSSVAAPADASGFGGKITIATTFGDMNRYLKAAIESYKTVNKDVTVEMVNFSNVDQYSQGINAGIMSGGGEDIIDVSWITWQKLADKDKLVDLNGYMTFTGEDYYMNILDSYIYKGARYTFPTAFYFNAFGFTDAYRDSEPAADLTIDSLLALADKYPDAKLFYGTGVTDGISLANMLVYLNFKDYVDMENKKAYADGGNFISFLNKAKTLSERIAAEADEDIMFRMYDMWKPDTAAWSERYILDGERAVPDGPDGLGIGSVDYSDMFLIINENGEGVFSTSSTDLMPAVNANSERIQAAADFAGHLISAEMQTSPEVGWSPVNRKAVAAVAEEFKNSGDAVTAAGDGFDLETNLEVFDGLVSRLAIWKTNDKFIWGFVWDELESFFEGTQTAEQAASNLQSRLTMYLNE